MLHASRGQALVEFSIGILVCLAILFLVIDFGRALYAYDLVASSARIGSRYASVHGSTCAVSGCPATPASIQTYVRSKIAGIDPTTVFVTPTYSKIAGSGCTDNSAIPMKAGCTVSVQVQYTFAFFIDSKITVLMTSSSQMTIWQ